jgi:protein required for attachment to host cells
MPRTRTLRIVIADGEHARFVQPDRHNALHTIEAFDSASAHQRSSDLGTDRPGRAFESAGMARHGVGERHDLHAQEKAKFARLVAERLNGEAAAGAFDELVVVAPSRSLQPLRDALNTAAAERLVGTLDKDLVKTPDDELWPYVRDWVAPARRGVA